MKLSRQAKQQKRLRREGRCVRCWEPADGAAHCARCLQELRTNNRKKFGHKAWHAGGRGRPPLWVKKGAQP